MPVRLLGAVWLGAFLVSLDYTALNVAMPTLAVDFAVGTSSVSWIALAYMLSMTALTPLTGHVIDRLGPVRALRGALVIFAAASLASALASDLWLLIAMRAVQGIGASVMFVVGPFVVRTAIAEERRDRAFALYSTAPTAGLCAGPAIGGLLTESFGWQSVLLFNLPVAALALTLLPIASHETSSPEHLPQPSRMPDLATAALAAGCLLTLLLALNQGQEWSWTSPRIVALFIASGVSLLVVVARERHATAPLVDPELFAARDFSVSALVFVPLLMVFGGGVFLLPFYFEWLRGLDPTAVGHLMLIPPVATIVAANVAGFVLAGVDRRFVCLLGIALFSAGVAAFAFLERDASLAMEGTALLLMGAGAGFYYPTLIQVGMASVPSRLAAAAASLQSAVRVFGQMLGVVVFESILSGIDPSVLDARSGFGASAAGSDLMQSAFQSTFLYGALLAALAVPVACMLGTGVRAAEPTGAMD